jgi:cytochrome c556
VAKVKCFRMKRIFLTTPFIVALTTSLFAQNATPARRSATVDFMRQKLNYSQGMLEGIVLEKYDLVLTNAALLRSMNLTNAFVKVGNPDYRADIADFQKRVDRLINAAKEQKLKSATEAYSRIVDSCVACHKQFRREQHLRAVRSDSRK